MFKESLMSKIIYIYLNICQLFSIVDLLLIKFWYMLKLSTQTNILNCIQIKFSVQSNWGENAEGSSPFSKTQIRETNIIE